MSLSRDANLRPGDLVDVHIRHARIRPPRHEQDDMLTLSYAEVQPGVYATISLRLETPDSRVTLTRVAPAEWPPQAGDLWRDKHGELWFIHESPPGVGPGPLMGRTASGLRWTDDVGQLIEDNAPLKLIHREGLERSEVSDVD